MCIFVEVNSRHGIYPLQLVLWVMLKFSFAMNVLTMTLDKMKDAVIAKLSSQCEELYVEVLKQFQKELLRPLWDKEWIPVVSIYIGNTTLLICTITLHYFQCNFFHTQFNC
jgi:hypothetical protein